MGNGAMYFSEMQANGGKGIGRNNAGAKYGTGYCDAQCPHDIKFIDGEANVIDWVPNPNDKSDNMGKGKYGACCSEMDIWEANSMATAYTPHTCSVEKLYRCEGIECGDNDKGQRYDGVCDKDGCHINPYRMGNTDFYGRGPEYAVNTLKPMTVVTQFLTTDGTDSGDLSEIRRSMSKMIWLFIVRRQQSWVLMILTLLLTVFVMPRKIYLEMSRIIRSTVE